MWKLVTLGLVLICGLLSQEADAQPNPGLSEKEIPSNQPVLALDSGGHTNAIYKLLATRYADQLISVGLDKTIRFWDLASGEPVRVLRPALGHGAQGYLFCAAISPDGKLLAAGGYRAQTPLYDHRIHLIALPEGRIVHSLKGHAYAIYDVAFSRDGRQLASASHDGTVRIWDVDTGASMVTLKGHTGVVHAVAWSADGKRLVSGSMDKTARIWSAAGGDAQAVLREHTAELMTVAWSPDGRSIATGCNDHAIRLYEPSGKLRFSWPKLPNEVTSVQFSPDSQRLLYTYGSNTVPPVGAAILDMVKGRELRRYTGHENSVLCGVFLQDGVLAATGDSISGIRLWNSTTGALVHRLEGRGKVMISAGWSPDGQAIAWGHSTKDATINLGGRLERTFCLSNLDFGPPPDKTFIRARPELGGQQMGIAVENGKMSRRKVGVQQQGGAMISTFTLPQPYDQVRCYSLLGNARAVVGTNDGAYMFSVNTGLVERELKDRGEEIWGLAPSPDFRYLLTAGNDQIVKVWNLESGEPLVSLFVAGDEWVAWTPEGYYAASLAGEGLMGWHLNQGPERMAEFYPASRFHKSLYRPDVIRRVLLSGDVYKALELADRERTVQSQKIVVADVLPPEVTITQPEQVQVDLNQSQLVVRASAKAVDKDPVTALRMIVNGRPYGAAQPVANEGVGNPQAPVEHEWTLDLPPGKHQVLVKAETAHSYGLSRPLEVTRTTESPTENVDGGEAAAASKDPTGKLYVLAIGGDAPASTDAKDAHAVAAALERAGKTQFEAVVTHVLTDRQATPAAINQQLDQLRSQMTLADTAVIFYAGHASVSGGGDYVLSSQPTSTVENQLSGTRLKEQLSAIPGRLMLVLDMTHDAEQARRDSAAGYCNSSQHDAGGQRTDTVASEWLRELLTEDYGVIIVSASRRALATKSTASGGMSALVQSFTEAVGGQADADHDGTVYLHELAPYLTRRVRELTSEKQTPTIERPRGMPSIPLARPGVPPDTAKP